MSTEITLAQAGTRALEAYIAAGDIGKLDAGQRISLYKAVCDSLGLNPLTQPFEYLRLSGGVQLYAKKSCTEQLRQIHGVSVLALEQEIRGDILCMTARVRDRTGREDVATGAVNLKGLAGENLANAYMKCETKAKRRATLSICGLAVLDETEIDSIAGAKAIPVEEFHSPAAAAPKALPAPTREERREDVEALLSPVPEAKRKPAEKTAETLEVMIPPSASVGTVETPGGRCYRIDIAGQPAPLAVLDEKILSLIEANQAFNVETRAKVEIRKGKRIVVSVLEEVPF